MIKINIILKGNLYYYLGHKEKRTNLVVSMKNSSKVSDLFEEINLPKKHVVLITINNKVSSLKAKLKDKDIVSLYPMLGGG